MKTNNVLCDACGADITSTFNNVDYRLELRVERLPLRGDSCTDMYIVPPLDRDYHFCSKSCLTKWVVVGGKNNDVV